MKKLIPSLIMGSLLFGNGISAQTTAVPSKQAPVTTPDTTKQTPKTPAPSTPAPNDTSKAEPQPAVPTLKWQTFTFKDHGFSVSLPIKPEHNYQELTIPNTNTKIPYDTFISEPSEKVSYLVGVAKYPSEVNVSVPENNLEAAVNGTMGATPGGKLISSEMTTFMNNKAVDFVIEGNAFNMKGRYILVNNVLYQLMAAYEKDQKIDQDYLQFTDSFKLLN